MCGNDQGCYGTQLLRLGKGDYLQRLANTIATVSYGNVQVF